MRWDVNEDAYWEHVREDRENAYTSYRDGGIRHQDGKLYLDEELDEIEEERGWPIEELTEGDLLEIVEEYLGVQAESAQWDERFMCIDYSYIA